MKKLISPHMERCTGCQTCSLTCSRKVYGLDSPDAPTSPDRAGIHIRGNIFGGFEAVLCQACDPAPCARACPSGALTRRKGGGVRMERTLCIRCGFCARFCPAKAVYIDQATAVPYLCIHCGRCVSSCPQGCLELTDIP